MRTRQDGEGEGIEGDERAMRERIVYAMGPEREPAEDAGRRGVFARALVKRRDACECETRKMSDFLDCVLEDGETSCEKQLTGFSNLSDRIFIFLKLSGLDSRLALTLFATDDS